MVEKIIITLLVFVSCSVGLCFADDKKPSTQQGNDLALEIFHMNRTIEELGQQLKAQMVLEESNKELQKLQIAVTYLSFRSRSIETKSAELQRNQRQRDILMESIAKIEEDPEKWELYESVYLPNTTVTKPKDFSLSDYRLKMLKERLDEVETEIFTLETEIQGMVGDLSKYELYVQKQLGLLN